MPNFTVLVSRPIDETVRHEVNAIDARTAIAITRQTVESDPEFWDNEAGELDQDLAGDASYRAELDADVTECEERGACHRLHDAAPAMLTALKALREWAATMGGWEAPAWAAAEAAIREAEGDEAAS